MTTIFSKGLVLRTSSSSVSTFLIVTDAIKVIFTLILLP